MRSGVNSTLLCFVRLSRIYPSERSAAEPAMDRTQDPPSVTPSQPRTTYDTL